MSAPHLTLADIILLAALVVIAPLYSCFAGARIARGYAPARTPAYVRTIVSWWLIAATTLFAWWHLGRPFGALGLRLPLDARSLAGATLCVLMLAYVNGQWRAIKRLTPDKLERLVAGFGRTATILPHTRSEYRWFLILSATVGICEELLYRGYLVAVTSPLLTIAGAVVAAAVIFGFAHAYQGTLGVVKTASAGLAFGVVYVATGSLLWPAILHALLDIAGGTVAYRVLSVRSSGT